MHPHAGEPVQWDDYLSQCGAAMGQPSLRAIVNRFSGVPGVIGLHAGLPAAEAFPITSMSYTLRDGTQVTIDDPGTVRHPTASGLRHCAGVLRRKPPLMYAFKRHDLFGCMCCDRQIRQCQSIWQAVRHICLCLQLTAMQQYSISPMGHPPLAEWAAAHTQAQHSPPAPTATAITIGSNAALEVSTGTCDRCLQKSSALLQQLTHIHCKRLGVVPCAASSLRSMQHLLTASGAVVLTRSCAADAVHAAAGARRWRPDRGIHVFAHGGVDAEAARPPRHPSSHGRRRHAAGGAACSSAGVCGCQLQSIRLDAWKCHKVSATEHQVGCTGKS